MNVSVSSGWVDEVSSRLDIAVNNLRALVFLLTAAAVDHDDDQDDEDNSAARNDSNQNSSAHSRICRVRDRSPCVTSSAASKAYRVVGVVKLGVVVSDEGVSKYSFITTHRQDINLSCSRCSFDTISYVNAVAHWRDDVLSRVNFNYYIAHCAS